MRTALRFRILALVIASVVLPFLLAACMTPQQVMTQAALTGDTKAFEDGFKQSGGDLNTMAALEQAQPSCPGQTLLNPMQAAACAGQNAIVKLLLERKADPNAATPDKLTPLVLALENGHDETARLLAEAGAKPDAPNARGDTPLILCARKGNKALAELLLKNGASPLVKNKAGETALFVCADAGLARMLVALGADPRARNAAGETGLHAAARNGRADMARFFIEQGVDVGLRAKNGATALDIARGQDLPAAQAQTGGNARNSRMAGMRQRAAQAHNAAQADADKAPGSPEVAAVIEARLSQLLEQEQAAADAAARAGRSAEALAQYAGALDRAAVLGGAAEENLRLLVIRYAASLPQPPAMPEKAREHLVRGQYLLGKGQSVAQVEREMLEAQRLAPWWPEGYYNLGILQYGQNKFDEATRNLRLFIAAAPADPRARAAQDKIFEINMAREQAEKVQGMTGTWRADNGTQFSVSVSGNKMTIVSGGLSLNLDIKGTALEGSAESTAGRGPEGCVIPGQVHPVNGTYDADAKVIALEYLWSSYTEHYHCVNMWGLPSNCCLTCDKICDASTVAGTSKVALRLTPAQ
jgi:hypothetical protein